MPGGLFRAGDRIQVADQPNLGVGLICSRKRLKRSGRIAFDWPLPADLIQNRQPARRVTAGLLDGGMSGTGFLCRQDRLVTAGHLLRGGGSLGGGLEIGETVVIFGYLAQSDSTLQWLPDDSNIYSIKEHIAAQYSPMLRNYLDYSILQLDRPVTGFKPFEPNPSAAAQDMSVQVMGHPGANPMVRCQGWMMAPKGKSPYLRAALASIGGLSGAPVTNRHQQVIGILAGVEGFGRQDLVWRNKEPRFAARCSCSDLPWPEHHCSCPATRITPIDAIARYL